MIVPTYETTAMKKTIHGVTIFFSFEIILVLILLACIIKDAPNYVCVKEHTEQYEEIYCEGSLYKKTCTPYKRERTICDEYMEQ